MLRTTLCYIILFIFFQVSIGKVFTRCDLARELLRQGFPKDTLRHWVCLIEAESSRNTAYFGKCNKDGSENWGIFQINDEIWCTPRKPGGECNVRCEDLASSNLTLASRCAKLIYANFGFAEWSQWKDKCQDTLPNLKPCGIRV